MADPADAMAGPADAMIDAINAIRLADRSLTAKEVTSHEESVDHVGASFDATTCCM